MTIPRSALVYAALVLLALQPRPAGSQEPDTVPELPPRSGIERLEVELQAGATWAGNFFQAPDGVPEENVVSGTGELGLLLPFGGDRSFVYLNAGGQGYDNDFDPSLSLTGGGRLGGRVHLLEWRVGFRSKSPRIEVGDSLGFADVLLADVGYRLRPVRDLQLEALATFDQQSYGTDGTRDNHALEAGGALRYYGFGYELSPEVGATFGGRDVENDAEDYDQRTLWLRLSSNLGPDWYLSLRYRHRSRDYSTDDTLAGNFAREDERQDVTLTVDYSLSETWSVTGYFQFQDAESTKASRVFQTRYLWTGLTYRLR